MYCRNCGSFVPDGARFCSSCGTPQNVPAPNPKKPRTGLLVIIGLCALLVLVGTILIGLKGSKPTEEPEPALKKPSVVSTVPVTEPAPPPTTQEPRPTPPDNGWYEEGGKRYYYQNGTRTTGLEEIDNEYYFFYDDGSLAINADADYGDNTVHTGNYGQITAVTFGLIDGEWSSEKYRFGNNGSSSIKLLDTEVYNCDRMGFYLESNGLHGAKVNGTWKIYVRSNGSWIFADEIYYTEPSGTFEIRFSTPIDFDAITAYPTVQGNASYSSYFALVDVHILF